MLEYQLNYLGGRAERACRTAAAGNAGLPGAGSGQGTACAASGWGGRGQHAPWAEPKHFLPALFLVPSQQSCYALRPLVPE